MVWAEEKKIQQASIMGNHQKDHDNGLMQEPELQLPDLDLWVNQALPIQEGYSTELKGVIRNRQERLKVQIKEYAELVHLQKLRERD